VEQPEDDQREEPTPVDPIEKARVDLERAETADDEARLEILEELRGALEAELDTSVENGSSRH
jgi:hypothetical protein